MTQEPPTSSYCLSVQVTKSGDFWRVQAGAWHGVSGRWTRDFWHGDFEGLTNLNVTLDGGLMMIFNGDF